MGRSAQYKLDRRRSPRVQITYDVELGGAVERRELPFVLGVLADLSGKQEEPLPLLKGRKFIEIDRDNFNSVLKAIKPRLAFKVNDTLTADGSSLDVELRFVNIDDFEPEQIINQVGPLKKLLETRRQLSSLLATTDGNDLLTAELQKILNNTELLEKAGKEAGVVEAGTAGRAQLSNGTQRPETQAATVAEHEVSLLDEIIATSRIGRDDGEREQSRQQIAALVGEVIKGTVRVSKDHDVMIGARIVAIDKLLSDQLNAIMHLPEFQQLEASWRGLRYLVSQSETSTMLKIRLLNVSKDDLRRDLERAIEFDQSALFKHVYEEEYGTFGGEPIGALIGDYEFGVGPEDIAMLEKISNVAAAAFAPFIAAASPSMFRLDSYTELASPRDLAKIFDTVDSVKWRSFRESEDSRYVGLTLPRILMRLPNGSDSIPVEAFNFEENVGGLDNSNYLWGNAAYAFGACVTNAFAKYHWCAGIRGVEGGGLVEGLPTHIFKTDEGDIALKSPTEIGITDRREKELSDLGFIPLVHLKKADYAAFFSMQSCQKPKQYNADFANANARLCTQLQYVLTTSRFAHYLKAIMRDRVGSVMSRGDCERFLNQWVSRYVTATESTGTDALYPLREARIDVGEVPGKPGIYKAIVFLRPHFQLDELSVSLRMIVELPAPSK